MKCARGRTGIAAPLLFWATVAASSAQISPGPLNRGHASLEGITQCLKCHAPGKGVAADRCLVCHTALAERISGKKGLHARPGYAECQKCHIEHHGVDRDLVYWGKSGREALDHRETGFTLMGKHAKLACRDCHQSRLIQGQEKLVRAGVDLGRTYLGLGTTCLSCHTDEHRGQFAGRECTSCHAQDGWKPASAFDHQKTAAPLTGKHAAVACEKCHPAERAGAQSFRKYRGITSLSDCASCHLDVHRGAFGKTCGQCHSTAGWDRVDTMTGKGMRFDHDKTGFPLRGRHAPLVCDKCHAGGFKARLKHGFCSDCHADAHLGQLAARPDKGRCEACHTVDGFSPTLFSVDEHQKTRYPLRGAHLAVSCDACHPKVARDVVARLTGFSSRGNVASRTAQLRFNSTRCVDCHKDPHRGEVDRYLREGGCESCHRVESWQTSGFDHSKTRFPLAGGHAKALCSGCHLKGERLSLAGIPIACESCHSDPHAGQLTKPGLASPCERCHTALDWKPARFDHNRDSAYPLDGAHAQVACSACHPSEARGATAVARYKPLGTACKDCHGARIPKKGAQ